MELEAFRGSAILCLLIKQVLLDIVTLKHLSSINLTCTISTNSAAVISDTTIYVSLPQTR